MMMRQVESSYGNAGECVYQVESIDGILSTDDSSSLFVDSGARTKTAARLTLCTSSRFHGPDQVGFQFVQLVDFLDMHICKKLDDVPSRVTQMPLDYVIRYKVASSSLLYPNRVQCRQLASASIKICRALIVRVPDQSRRATREREDTLPFITWQNQYPPTWQKTQRPNGLLSLQSKQNQCSMTSKRNKEQQSLSQKAQSAKHKQHRTTSLSEKLL